MTGYSDKNEDSKVLIAGPEDQDFRLDIYLSEAFPEKSRTFFQRLIKDGAVLVNEKTVRPSVLLKEDDEIRIRFPEPVRLEISPENIPLDIVYEDEDVILVNKPKGMVVHPAPGHTAGTLVNALLYHCSDLSGINGVLRPGIVHRIDRDTTGIVIACKNDEAHLKISEQLKEHSVNRRYRAIVMGNLKEDSLTVDLPIGRDKKNRKKMAVDEQNGKNAVTHCRVLERFGSCTLIECRLETGRTHQIRVHMAHLGHPLLGDEVYGGRKTKDASQGQCLHAYLLGFVHPKDGRYMEFSVPDPEYFEKILNSLRSH